MDDTQIIKATIKELIPDDLNANKGTEYGNSLIENSLRKFGAGRSILLDKNNRIIAGNKTIENASQIGLDNVIIVETTGNQIVAVKRKDIDLDSAKGRELALADNATSKANIAWDEETIAQVAEQYSIIPEDWGVELEEFKEETGCGVSKGSLSDKFIIPPFSILNTISGQWQDRKNFWLSLGIKSELGRDAECLQTNFNEKDYGVKPMTGTSIFDPVLCELAYQWFNVPKGNILDPFAGGSVRGIVAAKLGFNYFGCDLRAEQIDANIANAKEVLNDAVLYPTWECGDSLNIDKIAEGYKADLLFSCPPYADLEVYSKDDRDLSNMDYNDFLIAYKEIIKKSVDMLKQDRFAVFVVGDVRDKKGFYRNFVSDTIECFQNAGALLYNEIILVNAVGTLAIRSGRQFSSGRKVGKQHQNVLVFYKGNPKNIKNNFKELDLSYLDQLSE